MVSTRAQISKANQATMTATEDENIQTIRTLEEKISELKEDAQRDRHTKNQDDERIKNLETALQKAQNDLQQAQTAAATQGSNPTGNFNTFVLTMNVYDNDVFINRSDDKKLYLKATNHENKVLCDLSAKHFDTFLESVREKIGDYALNRNQTFQVPVTKDGITTSLPLINHYGECTMTDVFDHAKSIWTPQNSTTVHENQNTTSQRRLQRCKDMCSGTVDTEYKRSLKRPTPSK